MAGPTCSVLSSALVTPKDLIDELVALTGSIEGRNDFSVRSTRAIGGLYEGEGRPFIWFMEPRVPEELSFITEALGFTPTCDVGLGAMCNQSADHQILAELALWLAERTAGFVDLGGTLSVPVGAPGRIVRVPYDTASGWESEYMVMDRVALRAWLACPTFAMVK